MNKDNYNPAARIEIGADGRIELPKQVITNTIAARAIYTKLRANHIKRIALDAEISGMIAGNAPYDVNKLREANLTHIANFNTLEPRSLYERAGLAYWNLLFNSEKIINFVFRFTNEPEAAAYADICSRNWDKVVRSSWRSFDTNVAVLCGQLVKLGISPVIWPDENEMFWRVVEYSKFFIPDQSASDIDLMSSMCVETEVPITHLIEVYNEFKDAPKSEINWNIDQIYKFLIMRANSVSGGAPSVTDWAELTRKITSGDVSFDRMYNDTVRLVSLYYKENNGKVSHFVFNPLWDTDSEFLYSKIGQYDSFDEAMLIFTQSPGEQFIHSNRGVGHKIYSICQAKMMMDNSLVDMARWSSTPILKSPSMTLKDSEQVRFYPGVPTHIGSAEFVQNTIGANLGGVISTSQYFSSLLQQNAAFSGDNPELPDKTMGSMAPSQVNLQAFREFGVLRNQVNHFYKTFDILFNQMVIRMLHADKTDKTYKISKEWQERCIDEGVPEIVFKVNKSADIKGLPAKVEVYATRAAGSGSQVADLVGLRELAPYIGSFGRREQEAFKRDIIKATRGPEYLAAYTQDSNDIDEVGGGASLAGVENAMMEEGKQPIFTLANDHRAHVSVHMALNNYVVQAVSEKQMDVITADKILTQSVPHTGEHIQALKQNIFATQFVAQLEKPYADIVRYAELNRRNAMKALQAQKEQQERDASETQKVMSEQERKDYVTQKEEARKDIKVRNQVERAANADQERGDSLKKKTDATVEAVQRKTAATVESIKKKTSGSGLEDINRIEDIEKTGLDSL
jgi:hypothetical protein